MDEDLLGYRFIDIVIFRVLFWNHSYITYEKYAKKLTFYPLPEMFAYQTKIVIVSREVRSPSKTKNLFEAKFNAKTLCSSPAELHTDTKFL